MQHHGGRRDMCGSLFPADGAALDDYLERTAWLNWATAWRTWPTAGPRILPLSICSSVLRCSSCSFLSTSSALPF